jgi:RimJ/RimL family protein N-acetyltransferase
MTLDLSAVDLTDEVVRTDRLVLRPYRPDDVDAVHRACQDDEAQRWLPIPSPYSRDDAVELVTATTVTGRAEKTALLTAVEADGEFVGSAGVHFQRSLLGPAVGYWIAPWARGHSYAAEAAAALARWAIRHGAHRLHLYADVGNLASQAVARRAGFTEEGVVRSCLPYRDGTHGDAVRFGRLADG